VASWLYKVGITRPWTRHVLPCHYSEPYLPSWEWQLTHMWKCLNSQAPMMISHNWTPLRHSHSKLYCCLISWSHVIPHHLWMPQWWVITEYCICPGLTISQPVSLHSHNNIFTTRWTIIFWHDSPLINGHQPRIHDSSEVKSTLPIPMVLS